MMFYVYVLKSLHDTKCYIGFTNDLKKRFVEHNEGKSKSTQNQLPFDLVYYESYKHQDDAIKREKSLKHFGQSYRQLKNRIGRSLEEIYNAR